MNTVGDAIQLAVETRKALQRADELLSRMSSAKPSVLSELVEPTLRLKERLEAELEELEIIARKAGV